MIDSEEWLREHYITRNRSFAEICDELSVGKSRLWRQLNRFGIKKVNTKRAVAKEWLRKRYVEDLAPVDVIAAECGMSADTVKSWASIYGLHRGQEFKTTDEGRSRYSKPHTDDAKFKMSRAKTKLDCGYTRGKLMLGQDRRYLHRIIAQEVLRRELTGFEVVHHMDCVKTNHHPLNLIVLGRDAHSALHIVMRRRPDLDQIAWLKENLFEAEYLGDADYQISPTFVEWNGAIGGGRLVG